MRHLNMTADLSLHPQASRYEIDFKKSFFGSHYGKLKNIKDIYDPTSIFTVAFGVGSDEWDSTLVCRRL